MAGIVSSHATMMSFRTPQRTFDLRSAAPTPRIERLTTCVVLTGPPRTDASAMIAADADCEVKLWMGRMR